MARVTVEDCITKVPNRFELVLLATHRARDLTGGAELTVERENDKDQVVALREIAEGSIDTEQLRQSLISSLQKHVEIKEPEDDSMEILAAAGKEWAGGTDEAEPGKEPAAAKSAKAKQTAVESAKAEQTAEGSAKAEQAAAKSAKAEQTAAKSAKAEQTAEPGQEPAAAESAKAEQAAEPGQEPAAEESAKAEPAAAASAKAGATDADKKAGKDIEEVGSDAPAETSGDESKEKSETD